MTGAGCPTAPARSEVGQPAPVANRAYLHGGVGANGTHRKKPAGLLDGADLPSPIVSVNRCMYVCYCRQLPPPSGRPEADGHPAGSSVAGGHVAPRPPPYRRTAETTRARARPPYDGRKRRNPHVWRGPDCRSEGKVPTRQRGAAMDRQRGAQKDHPPGEPLFRLPPRHRLLRSRATAVDHPPSPNPTTQEAERHESTKRAPPARAATTTKSSYCPRRTTEPQQERRTGGGRTARLGQSTVLALP